MLLSSASRNPAFACLLRQQMGGARRAVSWQRAGYAAKPWRCLGLLPAFGEPLPAVFCAWRAVHPVSIYRALDQDDVLAAVSRAWSVHRPQKLPATTDVVGWWNQYRRVWRPGKPKPDSWPALHAQAVSATLYGDSMIIRPAARISLRA